MLVQVVVGEMMSAEHADHSELVEAITSFFCGLSPKILCGEWRRREIRSFILVSLAAAAYFKSNYKHF